MNLDQIRMLAGVEIKSTQPRNFSKTKVNEDVRESSILTFWVVVDPTESSEVEDICWETTPEQFIRTAVLSSTQTEDYLRKFYHNIEFYGEKRDARHDAETRLTNRDKKLGVKSHKREEETEEFGESLNEHVKIYTNTEEYWEVCIDDFDKDENLTHVNKAFQKKGFDTELKNQAKLIVRVSKKHAKTAADAKKIVERIYVEVYPDVRGMHSVIKEFIGEEEPTQTQQPSITVSQPPCDSQDGACPMSEPEQPNFTTGQVVTHQGAEWNVVLPSFSGKVGIVPLNTADTDVDSIKLVDPSEIQPAIKNDEEEHNVTTTTPDDEPGAGDKASDFVVTIGQGGFSQNTGKSAVAMGMESEVKKDKQLNEIMQYQTDEAGERKIKVPQHVKQQLKDKIDELNADAKKIRPKDDWTANFNEDAARAFGCILDHLDKGTIASLQWAQVDMAKLESPMITMIPNDVYKFITTGGMTRSLKDLYKEVKAAKESK